MRKLFSAAIVAFGVGGALAAIPASAQPGGENYSDYYSQNNPAYEQGADPGYDPSYDQTYDQDYDQGAADPAYGDPYAYQNGYCDPTYGCPDDYAALPLYDGEVYYDGAWLGGPFYYRDWGGGRQFWTHGGWHNGRYRGGHFGAARSYRGGYANHYRGGYANRGYGGGFNRSYRSGGFAGRSGFSGRSYPNYHAQTQRAVRQFSRPNGFGGGRQSFRSSGGGGGGHSWQGRSQAQSQSGNSGRSWNGGGGHGGRHH